MTRGYASMLLQIKGLRLRTRSPILSRYLVVLPIAFPVKIALI